MASILIWVLVALAAAGTAMAFIADYVGGDGSKVFRNTAQPAIIAMIAVILFRGPLSQLAHWVIGNAEVVFKATLGLGVVMVLVGTKCLKYGIDMRRERARNTGIVMVLVGIGAALVAGIAGIVAHGVGNGLIQNWIKLNMKGANMDYWNMLGLFTRAPEGVAEWALIGGVIIMGLAQIVAAVADRYPRLNKLIDAALGVAAVASLPVQVVVWWALTHYHR